MRAKVVSIESASGFVDGEERLTLRIEDADAGFSRVRLRRGVIDTTHSLNLDDEISLTIAIGGGDSIARAVDAVGKAKAKLGSHLRAAGSHES